MLSVPDLDQALAAYSLMGFQVSPRAEHDALGTANHVFVFDSTYCELLGVVRPEVAKTSVGGALAAGSGVSGLALRGSADGARADYAEHGIVAGDAIEFSRDARVRDEVRRARFRISRLEENALPGFFTFVCEHLTPDFVWYAGAALHPNGVTRIAEVIVQADDPAGATSHFERIRLGAVSEEGGFWVANLGPRLTFHTPRELGDLYPGLNPGPLPPSAGVRSSGVPTDSVMSGTGVVFSTASIGDAVSCLEEGGLPYGTTERGSVYLLPEAACGTLVEFRQV